MNGTPQTHPSAGDVMRAFWARRRRAGYRNALVILRRFTNERQHPISHDVPALDRQACIDELNADMGVAA